MDYTYSGYRIYCVYGKVDSELTQELVEFWMANHAMPNARKARARVPQVVFIARNTAGRLAGVTTAYPSMLNGKRKLYFYRMYIQSADRVSGMMLFMAKRTRLYLRSLKIEDKPEGMAIVTENAKLMRPGMRREFERAGYTYIGKTRKRLDLWIYEF